MAMQLRDALRPYLPESRRVRTVGLPEDRPAAADLVRHLALLDAADVAAADASMTDATPPVEPGTLLVVAWRSADPAAAATVESVLSSVPEDAVSAVLLDRGALDAPWPRVLDAVTSVDAQVVDAVPVQGE